MPNAALALLHTEYQELTRRDLSTLTWDQTQSLAYYRADVTGPTPEGAFATGKAVVWVIGLRRLEKFIEGEGRLPRENNRTVIHRTEREVDRWLKRQRVLFRAGRLVTYQQRRLLCVPGFTFDPIEETWRAHRDAYEEFFRAQGRVPAARSSDPRERRLAAWADKQRWRYWKGGLPDRRRESLEQLPAWTWGARKPR